VQPGAPVIQPSAAAAAVPAPYALPSETPATGPTAPAGQAAETARGSGYAQLSRQVRQAGLLERRHGHYIARITVTVLLLAAGWTVFVLLGNSWWQLAVAAFLAVMFTQFGFLGHDAGHRQILGSKRASYLLGILLANLGVGLSYGWWVSKHNRHHAHPNTEGADPDIAIPAVAFSAGQARAGRRLARLVYRYQAYLFFPMLLGEAISLHVSSIRALARRPSLRRPAEAALLARRVPAASGRIRAVSNGVDHRYFDPAGFPAPQPGNAPEFVFTGTMDYPPNVDAVVWFANEILPLIRHTVPDAQFYIVGNGPSAEVLRLAQIEGVFVTGRVPDVRPYVAYATAGVAPKLQIPAATSAPINGYANAS